MTAARYASVIVPVAAFAINVQLGQILPYADCAGRSHWTAWTAVAMTGIAFATALAGLGKARAIANGQGASLVCASIGLIVTFAMSLQVTASLLVDPCAR